MVHAPLIALVWIQGRKQLHYANLFRQFGSNVTEMRGKGLRSSHNFMQIVRRGCLRSCVWWFRDANTLVISEKVHGAEDNTEHDLLDGGGLAGAPALHLLQMETVSLLKMEEDSLR